MGTHYMPRKRIKSDEIQGMLDDCMQRESELTQWEQSFIAELSDRGYPLTRRQEEILEQIWDKVTS